jgi:hypothetical protein
MEYDISPHNPESLAGQAIERSREMLRTLETSFKVRLGDEVTQADQLRALSDISVFLTNEIAFLWQQIESLLHLAGAAGPFVVQKEEEPRSAE